jgi:hypothetical protein
MFYGGKSQYQNLLVMISNEAPELYDLIRVLCLEGSFATKKYQNTFLFPSKKLIQHLKKLSDDDNEREAIDGIRALLLKGHFNKHDFTKSATIATVQAGNRVLEEPEEVAKLLKVSDKVVKDPRSQEIISVVYNYEGDLPPKTKSGPAVSLAAVGSGKRGGAETIQAQEVFDFTKKLVVNGNHMETFNNFTKAVTAALQYLKHTSNERFVEAKFYMSANPVVSWFLMTMMGCNDKALLKPSEVIALKPGYIHSGVIEEARTAGGYQFNMDMFNSLGAARKAALTELDKTAAAPIIKGLYDTFHPQQVRAKLAPNVDVDLKIRMDELRFLYDGTKHGSWTNMHDAIEDMCLPENYTDPAKRNIFTDRELYARELVHPQEACMSGPATFLRSVYLLYMPLTDDVEQKILGMYKGGKNGGAVTGGNPATINTLVFAGAKARAKVRKMAGKSPKLCRFAKSLTEEQKEKLKKILDGDAGCESDSSSSSDSESDSDSD